MFSRWRTARKGALKAHALLRALQQPKSLPAGITGAQVLDRKTRAERLRLRAVESLAQLAEHEAAEALIDLVLLGDRDRDEPLSRVALVALRSSRAPGIADAVAERALREAIDVLAVHREPRLLSRIEALIASGEATMPRWWCVAVCVAASYGHEPSRARIGELFGNPVGLAEVRWLTPMLAALVSGPPDDAWEVSAPVREILLRPPRPVGRVEGPLISLLVGAVGARPEIDPRWGELAFEISTHANASVAARATGALTRLGRDDDGLRQRMLERATLAHLAILSELGDERVRPRLLALLDSDSLRDLELGVRFLSTLGGLPRDRIEPAIVRAVRASDELVAEDLYPLLEQLGRFSDGALVDELIAAVGDARLIHEGDSYARARTALVAAIEALRPTPA